ncbi:hypothetical protein DYH09_16120 [bacterium CPR1]|nr:hypothetical protein [bacterium CPR1]
MLAVQEHLALHAALPLGGYREVEVDLDLVGTRWQDGLVCDLGLAQVSGLHVDEHGVVGRGNGPTIGDGVRAGVQVGQRHCHAIVRAATEEGLGSVSDVRLGGALQLVEHVIEGRLVFDLVNGELAQVWKVVVTRLDPLRAELARQDSVSLSFGDGTGSDVEKTAGHVGRGDEAEGDWSGFEVTAYPPPPRVALTGLVLELEKPGSLPPHWRANRQATRTARRLARPGWCVPRHCIRPPPTCLESN